MTTRPRRSGQTRADGAPTETAPATPAPTPVPDPPGAATGPGQAGPPPPDDRLVVLDEYTGPDGLLPVTVVVSHDAVFAGQRIRVPVTDRNAGLIERGFLEVELPEPGGWPWPE